MSVLAALLVSVGLLLGGTPHRLPAPARRAGASTARVSPVVSPTRRGAVWAGLLAGAASAVLAPGWVALVGVPVGVGVWDRVRRMEPRAVLRARETVREELPQVVDLVGALVRSGAAPDRALGAVARVVSAETRHQLQPFLGRLDLGGDVSAVWSELGAHPELGRLGTTLHRATTSGASVSRALDRLAQDLRASRRGELAVRVRQVEVRTTAPLGACLLPAFVLLGVVPLVAGAATSLVVT